MIKKAIYTFVLFFFLTSFMMAQGGNSIQYASSNPNTDPSPGNNGATVTLDYQATSGGRHSYRYIFELDPLTYMEVKYRNSQWEIYGFETGGTPEEILFYTSAVQSTPNPPNLTFGNWSNEMTNFSGTGTQSDITLPVELLALDAQTIDGGKSLLTWATASEINNDGFDIEASQDAVGFDKIAFVRGSGTTNHEKKYHFMDERVNEGLTYYRLKQIDFDGKSTYSKVVSVLRITDKFNAISITPNPASTILNIVLESKNDDNLEIKLLDIFGETVQHQRTTTNQGLTNQSLDLQDLPNGIYFLHLQQGADRIIKKIIKE
ncbi:MAG: T9SS type A sorting domain-containing protein [Saprospiraceae bacterium]|nr:T9SS type A sorting domain-containing protein [Saprospiraceae bacterium]